MLDRLLQYGLNGCIMLLILASAMLALGLGYGGLLELLSHNLSDAALSVFTGLLLGTGAYLLSINKHDLTYS